LCRSRPLHGFTLIELLVVVSIIVLLIGILLPALGQSRDVAQSLKCSSNLRQFGIGFLSYSVNNRDTFCSGSTDYAIGANLMGEHSEIDRIGWVADQVNGGYSLPGKLTCPTSEAKIEKWYKQALPNAARYRSLMDGGYNSNYTQTWYMAHAEMMPDATGYNYEHRYAGFTQVNRGPLNARLLNKAPISKVPMLTDSRAKDGDTYTTPDGSGTLRVSKNMSDGPRLFYTAAGKFLTINPPPRFGIQDYENLGVNHTRSRNANADQHLFTTGNIVFADGHVKLFRDQHTADNGVATPDGRMDNYDLNGEVFDGVLSIGRRSGNLNMLQ
jgi:prepilin-type N-terminal cleavage/methylation domain-containing protein/prepilin-type processing-associated H-X9-DG protein